jgi:hypothetical protein
MTTRAPDRLFELLPALYREKDAAEGNQLRALLRIVNEQAEALEADIDGLWNDLFIETCSEWAIPYIGDLIGNDPIYDEGRVAEADTAASLFPDLAGPDLRPPIGIRSRADVAKTIYHRRRKGTLPALEELARDVTGWPAHAVEFFELLGWTQHLEHLRSAAGWFDVRSPERCDRVDGAFDEASRTVDVRPISSREGWHAVPNVGFFVWRQEGFPLANVPARRAGAAWKYHFSPLGNRTPLFSRWRPEGDEAGLATELHVPAPIRPPFLAADLARHRTPAPPFPSHTDLYGVFDSIPGSDVAPARECSLAVVRNGDPVEPARVVVSTLDPWPSSPPSGRVVAVDVASGRIAIGDGWSGATRSVDSYFLYGLPAALGGGPYERRKWLVRSCPGQPLKRYRVGQGPPPPGAPAPTHADLPAALADWVSEGRPDAVVSILDSRTYELPPKIALRADGQLAIEAVSGQRPLLMATAGLELTADPPSAGSFAAGTLTLGGVVLEGHLRLTGDVGRVRLIHSTVIPGRAFDDKGAATSTGPSLIVAAVVGGKPINRRLRVEVAFSVLGPLAVPEGAEGIWLRDSIVDGLGGHAIAGAPPAAGTPPSAAAPAAPLDVERTTILGAAHVRSLEASETIFAAPVAVLRRQTGCVRFSAVPSGSLTPRAYRCRSDRPSFTSTRYGSPAYAQLRHSCPVEIRTGAADGAEIGAYAHLKQPQRESNLRLRLSEYLPFGREPGLIHVT